MRASLYGTLSFYYIRTKSFLRQLFQRLALVTANRILIMLRYRCWLLRQQVVHHQRSAALAFHLARTLHHGTL